jgi:hypothetical protein
MDASCFFLESLKYIYLYNSSKTIQIPLFSWSDSSKCTWVTQGTAILHLFPGVAQVKFFWVLWENNGPLRTALSQNIPSMKIFTIFLKNYPFLISNKREQINSSPGFQTNLPSQNWTPKLSRITPFDGTNSYFRHKSISNFKNLTKSLTISQTEPIILKGFLKKKKKSKKHRTVNRGGFAQGGVKLHRA